MTIEIRTDEPFIKNRMQITQTIAQFWDKISSGWRTIWGPHIHHGYYEANEMTSPLTAQEKLIEKLAAFLLLKPNSHVLDVGCGMGGSSLYLAEKYQVNVTGITLSQKQIEIAREQAKLLNQNRVKFMIEDALSLAQFPDNSFDVIWSLESCEQFFDKALFLKQAFRVLKPGGQFMLATWCSDRDRYEGNHAKQYQKLCLAFDLPYMPSIAHYENILKKQNFKLLKTLNWSKHVEKSWQVGISLVNAYSFWKLLKIGGWRGFRFAKQIQLMNAGFQQHRIEYGVFLAEKKEE